MTKSPKSSHQQIIQENQKAWNNLSDQNHPLTRPASDKDLSDPLNLVDGFRWLDLTEGAKDRPLSGQRVLCLAAGGGKHSVLYTKLGGEVTVVDISQSMIDKDRQMARKLNMKFETHVASMHDLSFLPAFHDESLKFDLVVQPVSSCYYPDVSEVYKQVAQVLRGGGLYIVQHKQPINLQSGFAPNRDGKYTIEQSYYDKRPIPAPEVKTSDPTLHTSYKLRETGTNEYLHSWTALIGSLCQAGFVIENLFEPAYGDPKAPSSSFSHRCLYAPPYVRLKARRIDNSNGIPKAKKLFF